MSMNISKRSVLGVVVALAAVVAWQGETTPAAAAPSTFAKVISQVQPKMVKMKRDQHAVRHLLTKTRDTNFAEDPLMTLKTLNLTLNLTLIQILV